MLVLLNNVVAVPVYTAMLAKDCLCSVNVSVNRDACTHHKCLDANRTVTAAKSQPIVFAYNVVVWYRAML